MGRGRVPPPPRLTVDCSGMAFEELLKAVCAAVGPEDEDLAVQVIEEADRTALEPEIDFRTSEPYRYDDGEVVCKVHAFDSWLAGLANGFFRLPARMPRAVLQGFLGDPWLLRRCEGCLSWLPNRFQLSWPCPVCGGEDISHKCLYIPPGDPMSVYTPLDW